MPSILETVFRLDATGEVTALLQYAQKPEHPPQELLSAATRLLQGGRIRPAYILAMLLANRGHQDVAIWTALTLGGHLYDNAGEAARGLEGMRAQAQTLPAAQQTLLYDALIGPLTHPLVSPELYQNRIQRTHIFELLKEAVPPFRTRFNLEEPSAGSAIPSVRPQEGDWPVPAPLPSPTLPGPSRRVVIALRTAVYLYQTQWPRPLDLETRLATAMTRHGWRPFLCPVRCIDLVEDTRALQAACRNHQADIVILDEDLLLSRAVEHESRLTRSLQHQTVQLEQLSLLRAILPDLKVVGLLADTGSIDPPLLAETLSLLDAVWEVTPHASVTGPAAHSVSYKILPMPVPHGVDIDLLEQPLAPGLLFAGTETGYSRLWRAAADPLHLPIRWSLLPHLERLPARDHYLHYRQGLATESGYLNLATHPDRSDPVAPICFEAMLSGALLVQEYSPALHRYFRPGEHYLEFSSLAELAAITRFMTENQAAAEEIRRNGTLFARAHYSDTRWIGALEATLYNPTPPQETGSQRLPPKTALIPYEYISVHTWCQPVAANALLSATGNRIAYCHPLPLRHPPINFLGLRARGEGYADLFPWDEAALIFPEVDFKTHQVVPKASPFVARLENVLIDHPLFGIFLDRHLLMAESQHDKRSTRSNRDIWSHLHPDSATRFTVNVRGALPAPQVTLEVHYRVDHGKDRYEEGPAILIGGRGTDNYHHWMMEFLPRLWCMACIPELQTLPILLAPPVRPFQMETLQALGIAPERIRLVTANTRINTLIFPSHIAPKYSYSAHCLFWLRENLLPAFQVQAGVSASNRIYVSRNKAHHRRVLNEAAVIGPLQARGFTVLHMEGMSVKEQVAVFNTAKVVVMPHGAAGTNMAFAQPGTVLLELMPRSYLHAMCVLFTSFNGCHYGTLLCDDSGSPEHKDMAVPVETLLRIVDRIWADLT